ncbi:MAG: AAA family ATPase [Polyangiaceae bacterium]|nr:AAA family ATPase [Polyangiaceae bacterium]
MIRELRIEGHRSLRDVTWRPGQLNVLIGPNGSGKSNLLRALELLQDARRLQWEAVGGHPGPGRNGFTALGWPNGGAALDPRSGPRWRTPRSGATVSHLRTQTATARYRRLVSSFARASG